MMALQGMQWVTCLIYIDNIIVFGKDFDLHVQRVDEVLSSIQSAGQAETGQEPFAPENSYFP